MDKLHSKIRVRLLLSILAPVILFGIFISLLAFRFLMPPLVSHITERAEAALRHASQMGISICDERLSDMLDLRLASDPEMNLASQREAGQEIKRIAGLYPGVELLVIDREGRIVASSSPVPIKRLPKEAFKKATSGIETRNFWGEQVLIHYRYFPFWRWHIVSMIPEKDFLAPVHTAETIVAIGTLGVLIAVTAAVLVLFYWRVNLPLKRIIAGAGEVAGGNLVDVRVSHNDEIGEVASAFNAMVGSLRKDKEKIRVMMGELRDSEEQYRVLIEHSLAVIAVLQNRRFVFANRKVVETLGYDPVMASEITAASVVHPEDRGEFLQKIAELENGQRSVVHFETRFSARHGRVGWLEMMAVLILYREKPAVLIHALDITERKSEEVQRQELEERLKRAQKMEAIGTLAGSVAHDLNNILGSIVGYPDLLLTEIPEDSALRRPLNVIKDSGQRAAAIVQDMLTLARRGVAVRDVIDLNDIVCGYAESPEIEDLKSANPGVELFVNTTEAPMNIKGSAHHLGKILMNLVANAAEAMPEGGSLGITTERRYVDVPINGYETIPEGEYMVLSVSDVGVGISEEDLKKIFEPFYTKKVMGRSGTGLGMAVVWGSVKDHEGFIDVTSAEGLGSRFDIYLPATREEKSEKGGSGQMEEIRGSESVLVVDDVPEQREIASHMLRSLGYAVDTAATGEEAVAHLKRSSVDIVVLDMVMDPGLDGLETYRQMLEIHPAQRAIIASGYSETSRVRSARRLGAGPYVKKPYLIETLGRAVRAELDRP